jgi:hypothetical protein
MHPSEWKNPMKKMITEPTMVKIYRRLGSVFKSWFQETADRHT